MNIMELICKAEEGKSLDIDEVTQLMSITDAEELNSLYAAARNIRDKKFGSKTFLYSFVYFSTYCRNNCSFCYFRNSNKLPRYRKSKEEILQLSGGLRDAGINLVDLTMGEDPYMIKNNYENLLDIVRGVRETIDIGIMVSPGAMEKEIFPLLKEAGADWYACYQETYEKDIFTKMRLEQDYQNRINQRIWARESGILAEDGMLIGIGETVRDRADTILRMVNSGCEQIRAMTFVPQDGTPMENVAVRDSSDELKAIAVMRLLNQGCLIPASLDVEGTVGLKSRINAGANVITSIIPPHQNLAGVAQPELNIDDGHRSIDYVTDLLEEMGRRPATNAEYSAFLRENKAKLR